DPTLKPRAFWSVCNNGLRRTTHLGFRQTRASRMRNLIGLHGREEPMKGYQYDAFISYKRDPAFDVWMTTVVAILGSELQGYLGRDAALFFDVRDIKTGDAWDDSLRLALRTSKCLVPFVS